MNKILFSLFVISFFICVFLSIMFSGCTYNISMAHTEGTASDVIDDTQSNQPVVSPTVSIPAGVLP